MTDTKFLLYQCVHLGKGFSWNSINFNLKQKSGGTCNILIIINFNRHEVCKTNRPDKYLNVETVTSGVEPLTFCFRQDHRPAL